MNLAVAIEAVFTQQVLVCSPARQSLAAIGQAGVEGRRMETRALHNTYLAVAVEYGLIGFAFFAVMILSVIYGLHKARTQSRDPTVAHLAEAVQFGLVLHIDGGRQQQFPRWRTTTSLSSRSSWIRSWVRAP